MSTTANTPSLGHFDNYIKMVPEGNIFEILEKSRRQLIAMLITITEEKGDFAYAPGKWSIKEMIGHLCDAERIFAYRALRYARNDKTVLSPFEEDDYVKFSNFKERTLQDLSDEFSLLRQANLALFKSFDGTIMQRRGTSGKTEMSVENVIQIIAGHQLHHMKVLKERYLV